MRYERPSEIAEAVGLLACLGADGLPMAGGTDLLLRLQPDRHNTKTVVDLKAIEKLNRLELEQDGLHLGSAVSCRAFSRQDEIAQVYPGLFEAAGLIGSVQIQNRASIGGNLCNGSPAADTIPALIALGAQCCVSGPAGEREIAVEDFVVAPGKTALEQGELLVELYIPRPASGSASAYLRFIPRGEMDIAVVGCGASLTLDEDGICTAAKIALAAVAPTPILVSAAAEVLIGTSLDDDAIRNAAETASQAAGPISDKRGTAAYRRTVAGVLTRRVLALALARTREDLS